MKKIDYFILFTISAILLFSIDSQAQIVSGEAFLKGDFVEVGINDRGAYGSFNAAPAGYHPRPFFGGGDELGFVADADQDGFGVGSPDYCGDYFVPGTPEEGWGLTVDGANYNNNRAFVSDIPGSVSNYNATATEVSADWTGTIISGPGTGLMITQTTTVPVTGLYFLTEVTITNTTGATIPNVYYMRNVDPDNEQTVSGNFTTDQTLVDQPGVGGNIDRALVQAEGIDFGCYLGLGTLDCRSKVTYGGFSNRSAQNIYDGTFPFTQTPGATNRRDEAISVAFDLGDIPPGESRALAYAYVLNAAQLDLALNAAAAIQYFANGTNVTGPGNITVCPGTTVNFNIINGDEYTWTWSPNIEINTTTGTSVTINATASRTYTATGIGPCGTITKDLTVALDPTICPGAGGPAAAVQVPTMGEWGLITFGLLAMCFGLLFMMNTQPKVVGFQESSSMSDKSNYLPFVKNLYQKTLAFTMIGLAVVFAVSITFFGYEMTNADVPGSLIAGPVFAYLIHLMLLFKQEEQ